MSRLNNATAVITGGTGNVGSHLARALLADGARVIVPSRSPQKLQDLTQYLAQRLAPAALANLVPIVGDVSDDDEAHAIADQIVADFGVPIGLFAALGHFTPAPSLLASNNTALKQVLEDYVAAHFAVARAFLPRMRKTNADYVFVNGPLAFEPWENTASGLVSIATAGQHMLFRALAQELKRDPIRVIELVIYSFVRNRETQPGAAVSAEAVGAYAADLVAGTVAAAHGESVHLEAASLHAGQIKYAFGDVGKGRGGLSPDRPEPAEQR